MTESHKKKIKKLVVAWLLILSAAILQVVINIYFIYSGKFVASKIIYQSIALLDFSIILFATYISLKLRKMLRYLDD